ncbi:hypothetical protein ACH4ZU_28850 [Streptomyces sp. NPDC020472]|uniref:hypothetical protein n=1 Tax=Streptomyces sp. NPDC020472 TaxID=3365075 RepID=UPI0037AF1474
MHVECLPPQDVGRFAELGVVACAQARHRAPDVGDSWVPGRTIVEGATVFRR